MNLEERIQACKKCLLHKELPEGCFPIHGHGKKEYGFMIVGEAPGETEIDLQMPFVGSAGQMLDNILKSANIQRDKCYISNTVKCRPTTHHGKKNRTPYKEEINACKYWLWEEIKEVKPKIIISLGRIPTSLLLLNKIKKTFKMQDVVGTEYNVDYCEAIIIPAYHPSFLMQYGKSYFTSTVEIFKNAKAKINELYKKS